MPGEEHPAGVLSHEPNVRLQLRVGHVAERNSSTHNFYGFLVFSSLHLDGKLPTDSNKKTGESCEKYVYKNYKICINTFENTFLSIN